MSGAGNQMRVVPEGLRTSARVVTSKVRQWSTVVSAAKTRPAFANARLAETIPVDRKKSRRFILQLLELEILFLISYGRIAYTRLARSCKTRPWSLRPECWIPRGSKMQINTRLT